MVTAPTKGSNGEEGENRFSHMPCILLSTQACLTWDKSIAQLADDSIHAHYPVRCKMCLTELCCRYRPNCPEFFTNLNIKMHMSTMEVIG